MRADRSVPGTAGRLMAGAGRRWQDIAAIAIPLALVALTIGPSLIGRNTLASVTLLTGHMPWQAFYGVDAPGHQYCNTDTIDAVLPGTAYVRNQIFAGHLANWQPMISGGSPLGSMPNLALLSPLSLPYWIMPIWLAPAFVKLAEFVVAIGGMYLFLRRLGRGRLASSTAGVVFVTSGFMVMWTNWPQTRTAAWIPALFWAVERLLQRRRLTDVVLVGVVVASMLLGGFPAITGYALYLASAYFIVRVIALYRRQWRAGLVALGLAGFGLVLGAMLAAIQLLPFAETIANTDLSRRAQDRTVRLPFSGLLTAIAPDANGLCINADFRGLNPVELVAFVGAAAVTLAVVAASLLLWRRGSRGSRGDSAAPMFFIVSVAVIGILGWVGGPALGFAQNFPVFSNNFVGRIRSVFGFALAVLAAFGIDLLLAGRRGANGSGEQPPDPVDSAPDTTAPPPTKSPVEQRQRRRTALAVAWFVAVWAVVILVWLKATSVYGRTSMLAAWRLMRVHPLVVPVALVVITLIAALVAWLGNRWMRASSVFLVVILVLAQSVSFFRTVLPGNTLKDFYPVTGAHRFLAEHDGHDRFEGSGGTMYSATASYYGLRVATGHSFLEPEWADLLKAVDKKTRQSPTNYAFPSTVTPENVGDSSILDRMGVKYFAFDPTLLPGAATQLPAGDGSAVISQNGSLRCSVAGGPLWGIQFLGHDPVRAASADGITVNVTVRAGNKVITGARYLGAQLAGPAIVTVPVAGEGIAAGTRTEIDIRVHGGAGPASVVTSGGQALCQPVRPSADKLRLVYSDAGTIIFQRLAALPRIRWASRSVVLPDATARVAALKAGVPGDEVVLNSPAGSGSGAPATVRVTNDSGDRITARLDAAGAGYLVVADALYAPGWSVTVDGKRATLLRADHAMVGVAVPAGQHTVRLSYKAPGQLVGAALTGLGFLLSIGLLMVGRRRTRRAATASDGTLP